MSLPVLLIVLGVVLAVLVHYTLGLLLIVVGVVLLLIPLLQGGVR